MSFWLSKGKKEPLTYQPSSTQEILTGYIWQYNFVWYESEMKSKACKNSDNIVTYLIPNLYIFINPIDIYIYIITCIINPTEWLSVESPWIVKRKYGFLWFYFM